jgi:glycosyltransferase involved in cell wall biosynthesis
VVIPVRDRADVIGRAVVGVLAQTFGDVELVVVDDGSVDDTVAATRAVADHRVRVVSQDAAGDLAACGAGLAAAQGRWALLLDADTEVSASWLARIGRLVDSSGAGFVSCGGEQHHRDGSVTEIVPTHGAAAPACLRPGAFATSTDRLLTAHGRAAREATDPDPDPGAIGEIALRTALADQVEFLHTPERLVVWNEPPPEATPQGDELRLRLAFQGLEALARTPIPDGELLARYATIGGVAAARLRRRRDARLLFRIACQARPEVRKHWARLAVSHVSPLSRRIWDPTPTG